MKHFYLLLLLLFSIFLNGCESLLDYKLNQTEINDFGSKPLLCVYARYFDGQGIDLRISQTKSISGSMSDITEIDEVSVILSKSNNTVCLDTILKLADFKTFIGINKFFEIPHGGDSLYIKVNANGYEEVKGRTIIPEYVIIDTLLVDQYFTDHKNYRFTLFFTDPEPETYYFVSSLYHLSTFKIPSQGSPIPSDTVNQVIRMSINLTDPVFDFMPDVRSSVKEPFNNSERKPRMFSDKGFRNSQYGLNIEVQESDEFYAKQSDRDYDSKYELELYTISKDLFETYKSFYLNELTEADIYSEPVFIYSNMSNKVGFFGAYSLKSVKSAKIDRGDVLTYFNTNPEWYLLK